MRIYILMKDYKIETSKGTIILGRIGDQLLQSGYYDSSFDFVNDYKIKGKDFNIDVHYQFSVFNLDRSFRIKKSNKNWNINTFIVKNDDVYLLDSNEIKLKVEMALEYSIEDTGIISAFESQSVDYGVERSKIYVMLEDFSIESNKYKIANKGDLVISTGNYSNLFQFEVMSASRSIKEDELLNKGIFVVDRDKVLHLSDTYYSTKVLKDSYLKRALERLSLHNKYLHELKKFETILDEEYISKNITSESDTSNSHESNEEFLNNLLNDYGVASDDEDAFFDAFHN